MTALWSPLEHLTAGQGKPRVKDRYRSIVDVHVIRERGGQILLTERRGTGCCDGMYHLPSGHREEGETVVDGAIREAREEVGVTIDPADLRFAHVVHPRSPEGVGRIGVFFATARWTGEPANREPHTCAKLAWHDPDMLPHNTIPYAAAGITAYRRHVPFSLTAGTRLIPTAREDEGLRAETQERPPTATPCRAGRSNPATAGRCR